MAYELEIKAGSGNYKTWVAEITGTSTTYGLDRTFLYAADEDGSYKTYYLKDGYYSYKGGKGEIFIHVVNGEASEMTKVEMEAVMSKKTEREEKEAKLARAEKVIETYGQHPESLIAKADVPAFVAAYEKEHGARPTEKFLTKESYQDFTNFIAKTKKELEEM